MSAAPRAEERARKAAIVYADFSNDHYLPFTTVRNRSWKRDDELYRLRIKDIFGEKRLNEITRQQIQSFHASVKAEGLSTASADRHLKLIRNSQFAEPALEWGMINKNPAAGIKQFNEDNKVEHYLDDDELDRLVSVFRANDLPMVRIPATNSKSKKVRSIPLNESAMQVLEQLGTVGKSAHLFINPKTGERLTAVNKVWRDCGQRPHLRLHDLRHQFASFLVNAGRTIYEVQKIPGHSDTKVTKPSRTCRCDAGKVSESASDALTGAGRGVAMPEVLEAA